ncbi:hypothetical protein J2Z70_004394 [Paenibacillus silagei]|uniref:Paeninodin family lasso peptide n=1 Tax=Paenibacillus silagei TaxID=1670801 RepID=A0ABS4NVZ0_9BACL|nr:hypothetical protein [Paenibacillus silagei]
MEDIQAFIQKLDWETPEAEQAEAMGPSASPNILMQS